MASREEKIAQLRALDEAAKTREEKIARLRALDEAAANQKNPELTVREMYEQAPEGVKESLSNFPESFKGAVSDTYDMLTHPVETGKSALKLAKALGLKGVRKFQEATYGVDISPYQGEETADAVGQFYKDRYGSLNKIRNTVIEDPFGALLDATSIGTLGPLGKARLAAKTVEPYSVASNITRELVGRRIPQALPDRIYESGVGLKHVDPDKQRKIVRSAMDKGVVPKQKGNVLDWWKDRKGADEVRRDINSLTTKADQLVANAGASGSGLFSNEIFQYYPDLQNKYKGMVPEGETKRATIADVESQMNDMINSRPVLDVEEVNKFKKHANAELYDEYGRRKKDVRSESWDTLRRGSRKALEDAVPGLEEVNKKAKELLDIEKPLKKSLKAMSSQQRILKGLAVGSGTGIAALGAHALGGPVAAGGVLALAYLSRPASKARIGIALNRIKNGASNWVPEGMTMGEVRAAAWLASQQRQAEQEQEKDRE